jgi:hypothetical protein
MARVVSVHLAVVPAEIKELLASTQQRQEHQDQDHALSPRSVFLVRRRQANKHALSALELITRINSACRLLDTSDHEALMLALDAPPH